MTNTKTAALVVSALVLSTGSALAGGSPGSLGVGAEYAMNGLTGGASVNYDLGKMHFGGFLSFFDNGNDETDYSIGGRFYYHVHSTAMADFGLGGALGWYSDEQQMGGNSDRATLLFFEPGIQIRAFITPNVALSFSAGIVIGLQDADGTAITGGSIAGSPVTGVAGVHYYFF